MPPPSRAQLDALRARQQRQRQVVEENRQRRQQAQRAPYPGRLRDLPRQADEERQVELTMPPNEGPQHTRPQGWWKTASGMWMRFSDMSNDYLDNIWNFVSARNRFSEVLREIADERNRRETAVVQERARAAWIQRRMEEAVRTAQELAEAQAQTETPVPDRIRRIRE